MEYNGGAVLAMTGKNCVAIASDMRFGVQAQTLSFNFAKVFRMSEKVFLGLSGLATDIQTLYAFFYMIIYTIIFFPLSCDTFVYPRTFSTSHHYT